MSLCVIYLKKRVPSNVSKMRKSPFAGIKMCRIRCGGLVRVVHCLYHLPAQWVRGGGVWTSFGRYLGRQSPGLRYPGLESRQPRREVPSDGDACCARAAVDHTCAALRQYAAELGLVFQIVDDVLDVSATTAQLGKPAGSDAENDKAAFVTLYGLDGARKLAETHNAAALAALREFGEEADFLCRMAQELPTRRK